MSLMKLLDLVRAHRTAGGGSICSGWIKISYFMFLAIWFLTSPLYKFCWVKFQYDTPSRL